MHAWLQVCSLTTWNAAPSLTLRKKTVTSTRTGVSLTSTTTAVHQRRSLTFCSAACPLPRSSRTPSYLFRSIASNRSLECTHYKRQHTPERYCLYSHITPSHYSFRGCYSSS